MNKNLDTQDKAQLKLFTNTIPMTDDWFKQNDYLSVSSVRLNDFYNSTEGFITYQVDTSSYLIQFTSRCQDPFSFMNYINQY